MYYLETSQTPSIDAQIEEDIHFMQNSSFSPYTSLCKPL